ncbi:hypothetical protein [Psychroserpens mesophilus]|uniref:hypothetical protein n=1 Tax=Psychroserpens mesophilus TaxID=325473 RepID=UPI003D659D9D
MSRSNRQKTLGSIMGFEYVHFEFDLVQDYIRHMETYFETEINSIDQAYDEFLNSLGKEKKVNSEEDYISRNAHSESFVDAFFMFETVYKKNFRNSQIIQLYSFVEDALRGGCDRFADYKNTDYYVSDLKGYNDIDKIKTFLKKSVKLDFSLLNPEWRFLDDLRQVRNLVVHHGNIIQNGDTKNNKDKRFNNIKKFSEKKFTLEKSKYSESTYEIIFDNPLFFNEICRNLENLISKIGEIEVTSD